MAEKVTEQCELIVTGREGLVKNLLWDVFTQLRFISV